MGLSAVYKCGIFNHAKLIAIFNSDIDHFYECYKWTNEDRSRFQVNCTHYPELERPTCEDHPGYIYAHGNDTLAPGCGNCSCCKPVGK